MKNLKLYYISDDYINFLRQFDKNVYYNKNSIRPYIGIVYTYKNYNYFAPPLFPYMNTIYFVGGFAVNIRL